MGIGLKRRVTEPLAVRQPLISPRDHRGLADRRHHQQTPHRSRRPDTSRVRRGVDHHQRTRSRIAIGPLDGSLSRERPPLLYIELLANAHHVAAPPAIEGCRRAPSCGGRIRVDGQDRRRARDRNAITQGNNRHRRHDREDGHQRERQQDDVPGVQRSETTCRPPRQSVAAPSCDPVTAPTTSCPSPSSGTGRTPGGWACRRRHHSPRDRPTASWRWS